MNDTADEIRIHARVTGLVQGAEGRHSEIRRAHEGEAQGQRPFWVLASLRISMLRFSDER